MSEERAATNGKAMQIGQTKILWDDSKLRTTYANVCNVASTREEVMVLFGTNQAWKDASDEVTVSLSDRMLMTPYAAKRLHHMLGKSIEEYERQHGKLG
jgi:hypothetical protein